MQKANFYLQAGKYTISIHSPNNDVRGTILVQSKPADDVEPVITINAWTEESNIEFSATMQFPIYVSVLKGRMPVAGAVVAAVIENESGSVKKLSLKDKGIGKNKFYTLKQNSSRNTVSLF